MEGLHLQQKKMVKIQKVLTDGGKVIMRSGDEKKESGD